MKVCGVNKNMVSDREKRQERIRVADPKLHGMEAKINKKKKKKTQNRWSQINRNATLKVIPGAPILQHKKKKNLNIGCIMS